MIDKAMFISQNTKKLNIDKNLDKEALKKQTDDFEALFLKIVLDEALPKGDGFIPKVAGRDIYRSMYNDELSKSLSGGFGFSQLLFDFLTQKV